MPEVRYDHDLESEERHEHRDIRIGLVIKIGAGLLVAFAVVLVGLWLLYKLFAATDENVSRAPATEIQRVPPQPRLQVIPEEDLNQLQANQEAVLNSYGWVDRRRGVVRIPIDRAMDLIAERSLPVRSENATRGQGDAATRRAADQRGPDDSSSGSALERKP